MRKFLQDYGKQVLAVVSVFLMIAFFLPSNFKNDAMGSNPVVAYMGQEKVYGREVYDAKQDWELIEKLRCQNPNYQGQPLALLMLGPVASSQIHAHPELFLLLQKEAERMGITATPSDVEGVIRDALGAPTDDPREDAYRRAIARALLVQKGFMRARSVIKVSEPEREHELAIRGQAISLSFAEFDVAKYRGQVRPPTTQQAQEQFEKFRNNLKGQTSPTTNPFGFGYKYPNRVKLQYISVPRSEVRRAVQAKRDPHRWEVDAYKFYAQNQSRFPSTQASATTQSFSLETKKNPTTRPFAEVKQEIIDSLVEQETARLQQQVIEQIAAAMGGDYMAWSNGAGATRPGGATSAPAAGPTTAPGKTGYETFEYLKNLAAKVQAQHGVLPTVVSLTDKWLAPTEVAQLPGLGQARVGQESIAVYLGTSVASFIPPGMKTESMNLLHRDQPSQILQDEVGNFYILRATDAQSAHPPATLAEVEEQVKGDWVTAQAYQLAKAAAEKLLAEAKVGGLAPAAKAANVPVTATNTFMNDPETQVVGLPVSGDAKVAFLEQAYKLLSTPPAHPGAQRMRLIELPTAGKALVAELANVNPLWSPETKGYLAERAAGVLSGQEVSQFIRHWFDYESVVSRVGYRQTEAAGREQAPPPVEAPVF